jgi:predicted nucleic acid-binding protein
MPPLKPPRIYWDSCVFLSYFSKNYPDRYTNIQTILDEVEASKDSLKIVTSVLAKAEAAYIAEEKTDPADYPNMEAQFDKLWLNTHLVELVEVHDDIALQARSLTRTAFVNGWRRLRANDAIHLGTAVWMMKHVEVVAFQTYNIRDYEKFKEIVPFRIELPRPTPFQLTPG